MPLMRTRPRPTAEEFQLHQPGGALVDASKTTVRWPIAVNLVLIGPPGSGKGTQAMRLTCLTGVPVISTGDMLRRAVQANTPVGRTVKAAMERGELIGDDMMTAIVAARLREGDTARGFILDGFPRTVEQALALDAMMEHRGPLLVVELAVPEGALIRRLSLRRICDRCGMNAEPADGAVDSARESEGRARAGAGCRCGGSLQQRSDDCETVARERQRTYQRATRPLVDFYHQRRMLHAIDGTLPADLVTAQIGRAIESAAALSP